MPTPYLRSQSPVGRIGVRPDAPDAIVARKRGSRRPHTDATVAAVRRLIEETELTYTEIARRTGVAKASICRWRSAGGWKRPLFAPRATDTVPSARAGARLKARTLAARLAALAERHIRELEDAPTVDPEKLGEALELLKMAKLAARPKRRHRSADEITADASLQTWETGPRTVLRSLRGGGVETLRAPEDAVEDFIASRAPPPEKRPRRRSHLGARAREYEWLRQKEES